jgi:hypothetical protein
MSDFTVDQFKEALPPSVRKSMDQQMADKFNQLMNDPDMQETYRDNLMSYTQVMNEGKFKLSSYLDAVKYVSHRLMGKTMKGAYHSTFPDKIQDWTMRGVELKDQASYITAYNKTKLVNRIMEQSLVPLWVLNQDATQKAINKQVELMAGAKSEMVQMQAANSLLTHLKAPETQKLELEVSHKETSAIDELRRATQELASAQRLQVQSGQMNAEQIAHSKITYDNNTEEDV